MHLPCSVVLLLTLVTPVAARSSNANSASYLKALKRYINSENNDFMLDQLVLRAIAEERVVKRKYRLVAQYIFLIKPYDEQVPNHMSLHFSWTKNLLAKTKIAIHDLHLKNFLTEHSDIFDRSWLPNSDQIFKNKPNNLVWTERRAYTFREA